MRWIARDGKGNIVRGEGDPQESDTLFFVSEQGSKAIINGVFYINGKKVEGMSMKEFMEKEVFE